jgi:DICT domain-containing protein/GAF domain-containing protein
MKTSRSLLQDLLQAVPSIKAQIYFKTTLTALSHAMEDLVLAGLENPLVIANFQQERFYRQEAGRYQRIAQCTDQLYILAAPETDFASASTTYPTIGLDPADELAQEWHLVIIGQHQSACLICREYAAPVDAITLDSARQFRGFWTFDPMVSKQAAQLLFQHIRSYRPDLATQIKQAKQHYGLAAVQESVPINASPAELDIQLFSDRLVTYLQASQYKQVKAYRRIAIQEQQQRLVNQVTATIRQSLRPEDVLSLTLQEVSRLFGHCRGLIYRLPIEQSTVPRAVPWMMSESTHPALPSLLGQNWCLATHPQFQPILNQGNMVAIADTTQDSGIQTYPDLQQQLAQAQIRSCLLVPIFYQKQCLAVLELHQAHPHLWSGAERDLLAAISAQVGLVLLQAEAYVNLQQLNQQLIATKQTQTNLIAIVGHELRTPLATIQICLESLEEEPNMPLKYQRSMVKTALTDSERLRKLIQDFLLLSRLESNLTTWQLEPLNVSDFIALAITHLQTASQPRLLPTLIVEVPPGLPLAIADGEALFQLLSKLLDNACKFTPPTGTVTLKVKTMTAPAPQKPLQSQPLLAQPILEIEIADTGCGIEPYQLETIFERFNQAENFLQRAVGGTGLGLAICRQLAEQVGGQIWAISQGKGKGSHFYITLPALAY